MKKALCGFLSACLLLLTGCGNSVWDEPVLESGEEPVFSKGCELVALDEAGIIERAKTILCGTVTKKAYPDRVIPAEGERESDVEPCTIAYMTVTEVLKGAVQVGEEIPVLLNGNGITYIDGNIQDSGGYFQVGDTLLLFMNQMDDAAYKQCLRRQYARDKRPPYTPCSLTRGIFWLGEDGTLLHERNTTRLGLFTDCKTVEEMKEKYPFG